MKKLLLLLSLVCNTILVGQNGTIKVIAAKDIPLQKKTTTDALPKTVVSVATPTSTSQVVSITQQKDSMVFLDNPRALEIDSLWVHEMASTSLYDTIYSAIQTPSYTFLNIEQQSFSTDTLKARLARLNQKTPFNIAYNPELEQVIRSFLKNRRRSMAKLMQRSTFYFPLFEQELDSQNIPLEIKYLAIVESALNPRAKSRVGATGLWQFMYATGKIYGLEVNSYIDERADPIKSTKAASLYLSKLYKIFGDWDLALAAYNSGPGNVSKAIRRSGGYKNYWNLRPYLPRETAGYVPAFLATMYIFEYAKEHGFTKEIEMAEHPYFHTDTIHVKKTITFDQISSLIGVSSEEIAFFNPSYKLDVIPYISQEHHAIRLPIRALGRFVANEKQIYAYASEQLAKQEKPLPRLVSAQKSIRYRVKSGDFLGKIAKKFSVKISDLKRWNGLRSNRLKIGQRLTIYRKSARKSTRKTAAIQSSKKYTIQKGDSLWSIANKYPGISVQNLRNWNDISGKKLKPGMQIRLCNC